MASVAVKAGLLFLALLVSASILLSIFTPYLTIIGRIFHHHEGEGVSVRARIVALSNTTMIIRINTAIAPFKVENVYVKTISGRVVRATIESYTLKCKIPAPSSNPMEIPPYCTAEIIVRLNTSSVKEAIVTGRVFNKMVELIAKP